MSNTLLRKLQGIVGRHLYLALSGALLPCGGCISCNGMRNGGTYIESVRVPLQPSQQAELVAYLGNDTRVPKERCAALCATADTRRPGQLGGCALSAGVDEPLDSPRYLVCEYVVTHFLAAGRRPPGLELGPSQESPTLGAWLAHCAHLEAAAAIAFAQLHGELLCLDSPQVLRAGCIAAYADEVGHARMLASLARAAGCRPSRPTWAPRPPRSAFALALDNAVEGCVREAFGAVEALWQSHTARAPALRAAMGQIAADELRHAQLAFALHRWLQQRLTPSERQEVWSVQQSAFRELRTDLAARPDSGPELGLLCGPRAQLLLDDTVSVLACAAGDGERPA